jgi:hypothetical protein
MYLSYRNFHVSMVAQFGQSSSNFVGLVCTVAAAPLGLVVWVESLTKNLPKFSLIL